MLPVSVGFQEYQNYIYLYAVVFKIFMTINLIVTYSAIPSICFTGVGFMVDLWQPATEPNLIQANIT